MESKKHNIFELDIQRVFLVHPREGTIPGSFAEIPSLKFVNGGLEATFPFKPSVNEELNQILYGVDYEVIKDKVVSVPNAERITIAIDGTFSTLVDLPLRILSLDQAVALYDGQKSISICSTELDEDVTCSIHYEAEANRFARSKDLKNRIIELYRAEYLYPRWVETKWNQVRKGKGVNKEETPLKSIFIGVMAKDQVTGSSRYVQFEAEVEYVEPRKRNIHSWQPNNARTLTFFNLNPVRDEILVAAKNENPQSRAA